MPDYQKVIEIALAEEGYMEKRDNRNLDDKMENVGRGNFTKYARDLDAIHGFYNGPKQGFAWCDCFVDWCFVKAYGVDEAKRLLCQPSFSAGAGCTFSAQYYQAHGQFHHHPQPGDQIFFGNASMSTHTGLVYKVDESYVYTVEGNTGSGSGVIPNGGMVCTKRYPLLSGSIYGYGRPDYAGAEARPGTEPVAPPVPVNPAPTYFYNIQLPLLKPGMKHNSVLIVRALLGAEGDGPVYDDPVVAAVKSFQWRVGLLSDGEVGGDTWRALLNLT